MRGLSVRRKHRGPVVRRVPGNSDPLELTDDVLLLDQLTDFDEFFAPIYPDVRTLPWLIDGAEFYLPKEWDHQFDTMLDRYRGPEIDSFFAEHIATQDQRTVVVPGFVERYGKYLMDDWCDIIGLAEAPTDPEEFLRTLPDGPWARFLPTLRPQVEVAFFCIDGARWEVFAHSQEFLSAVRDHLSPRKDVQIREMSLHENMT